MTLKTTVYLSDSRGKNKKAVGRAEVAARGIIMVHIPEEFRAEIGYDKTLSFSFLEELPAETVDIGR